MQLPNETYGLKSSGGNRFSYAAGRRSFCKSVGLKPDSSGCASALKAAGWDKSKGKNEALKALCDAKILSSTDCVYYQTGGALPNGAGGINTGMLFLGLFVLLALIFGAYFLIRRMRKQ